ncbi:MAG TPA: DUF2934 domain-containing protein [Candidatus Omnitrophica bacterium]|nr:MAG: hypothetical protein DRP61_04185 [Candidatus Omnitrophota bacterium]RKY44919.1 MAG: hypothetical protein DRP80_00990 [Candidatus Omnitrophota bacterium]HEC68824.1 DUF2934 domain-containing protein [Candidatus Omnitrophota bacterium]
MFERSKGLKKSSKSKKSKEKFSPEQIFDFIQDRAYRLWDQAGRPQGRDWEFWFKAEKEVKNRLKKLGKI